MTHWVRSISRGVQSFMLAASLLPGVAHAGQEVFASTNIDAAFKAGLAKVKQATGTVAMEPAAMGNGWKPGLQLLVGVKASEGSKQTVYFIELLTKQPPVTNSAGQPWQPLLRTNWWAWGPTNRMKFITTNYPVQVRVFDENGRALKQGQTPMAWGMPTNSLFDLCRVGAEIFGSVTNVVEPGGKVEKRNTPPDPRIMRAMGGGFLWMMRMFGDLQSVPTVGDVWSKAQCAFRWPSLWGLAKSVVKGFHINMAPRPEKVSVVHNTGADPYTPLYCLPIDIRHESRDLTHVQLLLAPAHGAEMLFGGIRTIHARHPTKRNHEFITQVLSTGSARANVERPASNAQR